VTDAVAWLDCSSGISGDMVLGALHSLGVVDVREVARQLPLDVDVEISDVRRAGLAATRVQVRPKADQPHRHLAEVLEIVGRADLDEAVRQSASDVFERLARAEGAVHGVGPETVEFHEVGAVDAIVDVVAGCVGLHALAADVVVSPIALGAGTTRSQHGVLPVPAPAVLGLLADSRLVGFSGEADVEMATPTGVALAAAFATGSGGMPAMSVTKIGLGAGGRDRPQQPNVLRVVTGTLASAPGGSEWRLLEANVDDLDPRLWPVVLDRLLAAGAADAWLAPIVMKKGRPAHTLVALARDDFVDDVATAIFAESSTIGLRWSSVGKRELDRDWVHVDVGGQPVRVKVARLGGKVVNASPEFDDVSRAAGALGQPVKAVLSAAIAAAHAALS